MLLSPACASFDQYRNFEVRGDAFRALVEALPGIELRRPSHDMCVPTACASLAMPTLARMPTAWNDSRMAPVTPPSVMLAAGGTGGHLFPAFALAQELGRRGIAVDLVTDMRGDRYGTSFPARAIYRVPSATFAGRSILGGGTDGVDARRAASPPRSSCWARSSRAPWSVSAAIRRFRRWSPRGCAASRRRCTSRTRCSAAPIARSPST